MRFQLHCVKILEKKTSKCMRLLFKIWYIPYIECLTCEKDMYTFLSIPSSGIVNVSSFKYPSLSTYCGFSSVLAFDFRSLNAGMLDFPCLQLWKNTSLHMILLLPFLQHFNLMCFLSLDAMFEQVYLKNLFEIRSGWWPK